jgi:hypothetical protein
MQKEALALARDIIDIRQPLSLEAALQTPFLTENIVEDKFSSPITSLWNSMKPSVCESFFYLPLSSSLRIDEIVENLAVNIIRTGELKDFLNASLACRQFYVVFQRALIWY